MDLGEKIILFSLGKFFSVYWLIYFFEFAIKLLLKKLDLIFLKNTNKWELKINKMENNK